jgi:Ca-activated chloride channel family protein
MKRVIRPGAPLPRLLAFAASALLVLCATSPPPAHAAGLLIADGGFGGQLQIKEHDVKVTINNGIAVTTVSQVFQNMEDRQVEALYTFPVPKGASVANFSMWINGQEMVGEVVEKKRAREIYESYKVTRQDPGLLEQVDFKTFEMRVFPINARPEQRVQVTYYQELDVDHDWDHVTSTRWRPTTRGDQPDATTRGRFALNVEARARCRSSRRVQPYTRTPLPSRGTPTATGRRAWRRGRGPQRDVVLAYKLSRPAHRRRPLHRQAERRGRLLLPTLTAGEALKAQADAGMTTCSCSTCPAAWTTTASWTVAAVAGAFVRLAEAGDRVELIAFNVQPTPLFGSLTEAGDDAKAKAIEFPRARARPAGGTVLHPALSAAYRYAAAGADAERRPAERRAHETGEARQLADLIQQRPANCRVFSVGRRQRREPRRCSRTCGALRRLAGRSVARRRLRAPGAGLPPQARTPRRHRREDRPRGRRRLRRRAQAARQPLPRLARCAIYGRYKKPGDGEGARAGERERRAARPGGGRRPARRRRRQPGDRADVGVAPRAAAAEGGRRDGLALVGVGEIVRLGEGYSIVTEYTSFIVLENDSEYRRWSIDRKNALRVERDRRGQLALQQQLERMRDAAAQKLGPALASPTPANSPGPIDVASAVPVLPRRRRARSPSRS